MTEDLPPVTIMMLVGSLRQASVNARLAQAIIAHAPTSTVVEPFNRIAELPWYSEDVDGEDVAAAVAELRAAAERAGALLVVTPEYNGTIPGALKNVIDWLSRPYGRSPVKGKPAAAVGASLGQYGGAWAHDDTRKALSIVGTHIIETLHVSVPTKSLNGKDPAEHPQLMDDLMQVLSDLSAAART